MSFDPYHKWLGIPPEQQPPNHYRLLGIDLFEADPDVIDAAASQRVAYLKSVATGEHAHESQKLLGEIAAARRCLLRPETKTEYDARLAAGFELPRRGPSLARLIVAGGALAAVLAVILIVVVSARSGNGSGGEAPPPGQAVLVLDWPLEEREDARIEIDGELRELPDEREVRFVLSPGRHRLLLTREGYYIDAPLVFEEGQVRRLRLNWQRDE